MTVFPTGTRGKKSRFGSRVQKLLRAPSEPDESRPIHRQLRPSHRSEHKPRNGSDAQEGKFDPLGPGYEHHGCLQPPRRRHRHIKWKARPHQQYVDESKFIFPQTVQKRYLSKSVLMKLR